MTTKYVPNGSGLYIPESIRNLRGFSVPDGTGYIPRRPLRCKDSDKLIYPPTYSYWDTFGSAKTNHYSTYWPSPPFSGYDDSYTDIVIGVSSPNWRVTSVF